MMAKFSSQSVRDEDNPEIQITLVFDPANFGQLKDLSLLRDGWRELEESRPTVTYFDAPGWPLIDSNASLWVERQGRRYRKYLETATSKVGIATVCKLQGSPIRTSRPTLSGFPDQGGCKLSNCYLPDKLERFGRKGLRRTTRQMNLEDGGRIAVAIDIGETTVNSVKSPVGEVTLSITSGPRDFLFNLCLRIAELVPVRAASESPAKTARALLPEQTPESRKADALDLPADIAVDGALAHTGQECLSHISANEACMLHSEDPEGVHQIRVGVRRLRSALRAYRPILPAEQYAWLNGELSCLGEQMGTARDWDVFADEIVKPAAVGRSEEMAFRAFQAHISAYRTAGRQAARDTIRSKRYTTLLLRSSAWLAASAWRDQPVSETSALLFGPVRAFADGS